MPGLNAQMPSQSTSHLATKLSPWSFSQPLFMVARSSTQLVSVCAEGDIWLLGLVSIVVTRFWKLAQLVGVKLVAPAHPVSLGMISCVARPVSLKIVLVS